MKKILNFLYFLIRPSYWIMVHKYDAEWDKDFNELMSKHSFVYHNDYVAILGDETIRIVNHPFGS